MAKHKNALAFPETAAPGGFITTMGYIATAVAGVMALGAGTALALALSWPDIRRYLHISSL